MAVNALLARVRVYIYDREDLGELLDELLQADDDTQRVVAEYLAGHGLMIARLVAPGKPAESWRWMASSYLLALRQVMKKRALHVETIGWGTLRSPEQLAALPLKGP